MNLLQLQDDFLLSAAVPQVFQVLLEVEGFKNT